MKKFAIAIAVAALLSGCGGHNLDLASTERLETAVAAPPPPESCEEAVRTKKLLEDYRIQGTNDAWVERNSRWVDDLLKDCGYTTTG